MAKKDWVKVKIGFRSNNGKRDIRIQKVVRNTPKQSQLAWGFIVVDNTNYTDPIIYQSKYTTTKRELLKEINRYMRKN